MMGEIVSVLEWAPGIKRPTLPDYREVPQLLVPLEGRTAHLFS